MAKHVSTTSPRSIAPAKTDWQRTERDIQRRIEQATLGLGRWRDSDMPRWNKVPFSHYVTNVHEWERNETWVNWATGITIALVVHPAGEAFTRGTPYAWCKTGKRPLEKETFSIEPVFGRFIANTPRGPKVLVRNGVAAVLGLVVRAMTECGGALAVVFVTARAHAFVVVRCLTAMMDSP